VLHSRPTIDLRPRKGTRLDIGDFFNVERSLDTTVFILLAVVGFGVLVVSYIVGEVADVAGDFGDGDFADGVINTHTVSAFLAGFGALGWLLSGYWGVDPLLSALGGLLGGIPLAGSVLLMGRALAGQAGSSNFVLTDLVGSEAVVTLRIAPGSVGYVEYRHAGGRHRSVARSEAATVIPEGAIVQITRIVGGEMLVATRDSQSGSTSTVEPA
jgi:hypothetical protein